MLRTIGILFLTALIISSTASASDSLRTVREFGHRVLSNLNCTDTLNGNDLIDSTDAQRHVRDAVVDVGAMIPTENAKTITTTAGTFGYEVDAHFDSVRAAMVKRGRFSELIPTGTFDGFTAAYDQMAHVYDTGAYEFCAIHGDSLYLYPIPARVDTIYIFFWARGDVPSTYADTVDMPHELYSSVEYLATMRAAARILDVAREGEYMKLFQIEISKFMGDKKPQ